MAKAKKEIAGDKDKINVVLEAIQEKFGEGMMMKLGDVHRVDVEVIPTGSISLDIALGIGGVPRGRIVEIYGPESLVKRHFHFISLPMLRKRVVSQRLLMQNTLSILNMPNVSV